MYRLRITSDLGFEVWADIPGYEGLYQVSTYGRIKRAKHFLKCAAKYKRVPLCKDGKCKTYLLHRLVATVFIPNPNNYPVINHIDENPSNNNIENLEWCTQEHNIRHGTRTARAAASLMGHTVSLETRNKISNSKKHVKVGRFDENGNLITIYNSLVDAAADCNIKKSTVYHLCKGLTKKNRKGLYFQYI